MEHCLLKVLQVRTPNRWPNGNALRDSFLNNDGPAGRVTARYSYSCPITPEALPSGSHSSFQPLSRHETRVDLRASRRESRRMQRCLSVDRLHGPSTVQATCSQLCPLPHQDQYRLDESEHLFAPDCRRVELALRDRSRGSLRVHHL